MNTALSWIVLLNYMTCAVKVCKEEPSELPKLQVKNGLIFVDKELVEMLDPINSKIGNLRTSVKSTFSTIINKKEIIKANLIKITEQIKKILCSTQAPRKDKIFQLFKIIKKFLIGLRGEFILKISENLPILLKECEDLSELAMIFSEKSEILIKAKSKIGIKRDYQKHSIEEPIKQKINDLKKYNRILTDFLFNSEFALMDIQAETNLLISKVNLILSRLGNLDEKEPPEAFLIWILNTMAEENYSRKIFDLLEKYVAINSEFRTIKSKKNNLIKKLIRLISKDLIGDCRDSISSYLERNMFSSDENLTEGSEDSDLFEHV